MDGQHGGTGPRTGSTGGRVMAALIEKLRDRRKAAAKGAGDATRALSELRALGAKLRDERADLLDRPVPVEQAQSAAAEAVAAQAEKIVADLNLASLMKPADGRPPSLTLTIEQRVELAFAAQAGGVAALLSAALAERYAEHGHEGIDALERSAELARIDSDLFAVELSEEAVIREMEAGGAAPLRRPNADPRALLAADSELG